MTAWTTEDAEAAKANWARIVKKCARNPGRRWRLSADFDDHRRFNPENQGTFDELVVDHWLHIERMSKRIWWMSVGDARITVRIATNGDVSVNIQRGEYGKARGWTVNSNGQPITSEDNGE